MHVVATAGHVDHGKSTLVRALTGMEPDRWAEERRRGMTIDLGFAWTRLPDGGQVAFVDVPGHQRFIGNMLAGLGPAPAVMIVVAADEGWKPQSEEHLEAVDALGLRHGLLVVTRADLADPAATLADARARIARTSLGEVEAVAVSAVTGEGVPQVAAALGRLVARLPEPVTDGRVRLWVDRSFTVGGAGTVVTGTLGEGTVAVGDRLELDGRPVAVRGVQSLGEGLPRVAARARVALNLRGVPADGVGRGSVLLTPRAWHLTDQVDVDLGAPADPAAQSPTGDLPAQVMVHVGSGSWEAHVRPLDERFARLRLPEAAPLQAGDRLLLRDPGRRAVLGATVLDADPPALTRRGAAARRAEDLARTRARGGAEGAVPAGGPTPGARVDLTTEVGRRGAMRPQELALLGLTPAELAADHPGVVRVAEWLVSDERWQSWRADLLALCDERVRSHPMDPWVPLEQGRRALGVPDLPVLREVARSAGLDGSDGRLARPGTRPSLGAAEAGLQALEKQLGADPFAAPERGQLDEWGLGPRELAAAETAGRVLRLPDDVVLLPRAPALAMRELARLEQPFTTSAARQALGSTRRVVIPLLEHLDRRGWTRRTDGSHREVVR